MICVLRSWKWSNCLHLYTAGLKMSCSLKNRFPTNSTAVALSLFQLFLKALFWFRWQHTAKWLTSPAMEGSLNSDCILKKEHITFSIPTEKKRYTFGLCTVRRKRKTFLFFYSFILKNIFILPIKYFISKGFFMAGPLAYYFQQM